MTNKMLKFVSVAQKQPEKRSAEIRRADFDEIYKKFTPERAAEQASRCSQCGVPFCLVHCPLGNNIPDWLMLTAQGRLEEAFRVSSATNSFPDICGRVCPQDRLCEGHCVIEETGFQSVTIGAVERYITDTAFEQGWVKPIVPVCERKHSVGIIGAGPAGLAAASRLRAEGFQVHVYDRYDRVGGLLVYGIPGFKLEKHYVARWHKWLEESGVIFHLGRGIGSREGELSFEAVRFRHDALLIATGVYKPRELYIPGNYLSGVEHALAYLTASNKRSLGDHLPSHTHVLDAKGKSVVVLGGGDTAMDCVRTAIRQGAASVRCLYRRDKANMPGSRREVQNAEEEGVIFEWLVAPEAFLGKEYVKEVRAVRMMPGLPDASGRQSVEPIEGSSFTIKADLVIKALGFDPEPLPQFWQQPELTVTERGTLCVDRSSFMTSLPGVFAAGDIVRGASLVVWAIRDGQEAAACIQQWMEANVTSSVTAEQE
ncbi:MAG: NAD(P)-dependent oxidoreductase [Acetobacter sp.]|nr:NAD(P)-dependent oxidoreductase [Acetobacter sp.]